MCSIKGDTDSMRQQQWQHGQKGSWSCTRGSSEGRTNSRKSSSDSSDGSSKGLMQTVQATTRASGGAIMLSFPQQPLGHHDLYATGQNGCDPKLPCATVTVKTKNRLRDCRCQQDLACGSSLQRSS